MRGDAMEEEHKAHEEVHAGMWGGEREGIYIQNLFIYITGLQIASCSLSERGDGGRQHRWSCGICLYLHVRIHVACVL